MFLVWMFLSLWIVVLILGILLYGFCIDSKLIFFDKKSIYEHDFVSWNDSEEKRKQGKLKYKKAVKKENILYALKKTVVILIFIGIATLFCTLFCTLENDKSKVFRQEFIVQKELIEESISNENLSGFERIELVKQANELNSKLAYKKEMITKWYNWHIDDSIFENLKYISLKRE